MDQGEFRDVLAAIPLFGDVLGPARLAELAGKAREAVFPAGSVLMTEGDFGVSMFAIVEGSVAVSVGDPRGGEHGIATVYAGDVVGEMSLMTGARRNATVTARSDVVAIEITKVALEEILSRAPELIDSFGAVLAKRQAELDRIAADTAASQRDIVSQIKRFFPAVFGKDKSAG